MSKSPGKKIGEVAKATGISVPTLRHYDSVGLVSPSERTPSGYRLYSDTDFARLHLIRRMKPLGFTLEDMRQFIAASETLAASTTPTGDEAAAAQAMIEEIKVKAQTSYDKLRTKLGYAEEFLDDLSRM